jgi:hypothetical protein
MLIRKKTFICDNIKVMKIRTYLTLSTNYVSLGVIKNDNSLFYFNKDNVTMFLFVYVDDIIGAS